MLDSLTPPLVVGAVFFSIYKIFELFVRRNERLAIIQKLVESDCKNDGKSINLDLNLGSSSKFTSLRFGACLLGIGLGLIVGFIISTFTYPSGLFAAMEPEGLGSMVIGASVLIFGGLALLASFIIERKKQQPE